LCRTEDDQRRPMPGPASECQNGVLRRCRGSLLPCGCSCGM
jgi:hypothetical protein